LLYGGSFSFILHLCGIRPASIGPRLGTQRHDLPVLD